MLDFKSNPVKIIGIASAGVLATGAIFFGPQFLSQPKTEVLSESVAQNNSLNTATPSPIPQTITNTSLKSQADIVTKPSNSPLPVPSSSPVPINATGSITPPAIIYEGSCEGGFQPTITEGQRVNYQIGLDKDETLALEIRKSGIVILSQTLVGKGALPYFSGGTYDFQMTKSGDDCTYRKFTIE